jgi:hypothetical protein
MQYVFFLSLTHYKSFLWIFEREKEKKKNWSNEHGVKVNHSPFHFILFLILHSLSLSFFKLQFEILPISACVYKLYIYIGVNEVSKKKEKKKNHHFTFVLQKKTIIIIIITTLFFFVFKNNMVLKFCTVFILIFFFCKQNIHRGSESSSFFAYYFFIFVCVCVFF